MKRLLGLVCASYVGLAETGAQPAMAAIGQNPLQAKNKITFTPQFLAIA